MSSEPRNSASTVDQARETECDHCNRFEFEVSYSGAPGTPAAKAVEDATLPERCPVCGSKLTHCSGI